MIVKADSSPAKKYAIKYLELVTVFKVRVRNSDIQKGKNGGYRLIYQLESPTSIILLLIYSKLDQTDVAAEEIQSVIEKFQKYEEP